MFLLSKKSWHVGKSENIARVRRDEEQAAAEAESAEQQARLVDGERRLAALRSRAHGSTAPLSLAPTAERPPSVSPPPEQPPARGLEIIGERGHVNLFADAETEARKKAGHPEYLSERDRAELRDKEAHRLGSGAAEVTKTQLWYEARPGAGGSCATPSSSSSLSESQRLSALDPLAAMKTMISHTREVQREQTRDQGTREENENYDTDAIVTLTCTRLRALSSGIRAKTSIN